MKRMINPYNKRILTETGATITLTCGSYTGKSSMVVVEKCGGGTMNDIGCQEVGNLEGGMYDKIHEQSKRVYGDDGLSPTIHTMGGGGQEIKILDEQNGYIRDDGTVGTITTDGSSPKHNNRVAQGFRIRKLTPRECWRLMDFTDEQFEKAKEVNSDSQLYKQAGNSIVVKCMELIFRMMMEGGDAK